MTDLDRDLMAFRQLRLSAIIANVVGVVNLWALAACSVFDSNFLIWKREESDARERQTAIREEQVEKEMQRVEIEKQVLESQKQKVEREKEEIERQKVEIQKEKERIERDKVEGEREESR